jgi:hypothetical protein
MLFFFRGENKMHAKNSTFRVMMEQRHDLDEERHMVNTIVTLLYPPSTLTNNTIACRDCELRLRLQGAKTLAHKNCNSSYRVEQKQHFFYR